MFFRFSPRVTTICLFFMVLFGLLSRWQWSRYLEKQVVVARLEQNFEAPPVPLRELRVEDGSWQTFIHRKVTVQGTYDFDNEVVLKNRRFKGLAGAHVVTPLKIKDSDRTVLVDRGFIPIGKTELPARQEFQRTREASFTGLVKESMYRKVFSPADPPTGPGHPRIDAFYRIDIPAIANQIPYPVLPIYLEIMSTSDSKTAVQEVLGGNDEGGRDELLSMNHGMTQTFGMAIPNLDYPIPMFNTILPPSRHLGYVWEWAFMALMVGAIGFVLQLRRPTRRPSPD